MTSNLKRPVQILGRVTPAAARQIKGLAAVRGVALGVLFEEWAARDAAVIAGTGDRMVPRPVQEVHDGART